VLRHSTSSSHKSEPRGRIFLIRRALSSSSTIASFCRIAYCATRRYLHMPLLLWGLWRTACSRVLLEKLIVTHLVKKLPAFHRIRRFITVFTSVHNWSLPWARWRQSIIFHLTSSKFVVILFSHLLVGPCGILFFFNTFTFIITVILLAYHQCHQTYTISSRSHVPLNFSIRSLSFSGCLTKAPSFFHLPHALN